ncbi:MAG: aldo/keto reductase [Chloroflexi bacterium]|nr:aldo/keto reductase [Chloroflexota bacterium]
MKNIRLGDQGPAIEPLGLGAWAWGDRVVWNYGSGYGEQDIRDAFDVSLAAGIRLFDTAEIYGTGRSESLLGKFAAVQRGEVFIASKCFPYPWRLWAGTLRGALKRSLQRLDVEQIDLYQMHWPSPPVAIERWMHAMADAKEAGLIQHVGVSNYNYNQLERAHRVLETRGHKLASNQIVYSLLRRGAEFNGHLALCEALDVTVIAYSPLAQGLLTGKYGPESPPPGARRVRFGEDELARGARLSSEMQRIGAQHGGKSAPQVALNWAIQKGTLPIPGAKNGRQAEENAGALGWDLSSEEVEKLDALSARNEI